MAKQNRVFLISGNAGSGKTSVAVNLAYTLRAFGFDVLLVDADLHTPKIAYALGIPLTQKTIQGVLLGKLNLADTIMQTPVGVKVLPAGLARIKTQHPSSILSSLSTLADIVILDVPSTELSLYPSHIERILVTHPDFPSAFHLRHLLLSGKTLGFIITRMHKDSIDLSPANMSQIIGIPLLGVIPDEPKIRESLKLGYPLAQLYPDLATTVAFKQTAAKLMNVEYHAPLKKKPSLFFRLGFF